MPLALALALHTLAAGDPERVERLYSEGVYPWVAWALVAASGWLRASLAEWLTAALLLGVVILAAARFRIARRRGGGRWRALAATLAVLVFAAGALYLGFLLLWGLNHQRPTYAALAGLDAGPAAVAELRALSEELVIRANAARAGLSEDDAGVMHLVDGREGAMRRATHGFAALDGRSAELVAALPDAVPKLPLVSPLLWRVGISGMYVPFTGEAHVNATLPDPDVPFAACHELAHLAGFAREDEANYVGYRACAAHPDPDFRYSALFAASLHATAALAAVDRSAFEELRRTRSAAMARDVEALRRWAARYGGAVRRAARRVNDAYLKSQGHAEGVRSYGRMVDLLIAERRARLKRVP